MKELTEQINPILVSNFDNYGNFATIEDVKGNLPASAYPAIFDAMREYGRRMYYEGQTQGEQVAQMQIDDYIRNSKTMDELLSKVSSGDDSGLPF
jgi:hypothetical protein